MVTEKKVDHAEVIDKLFAKATTDLSVLKSVSSYIRIGKQWDLKHSEVVNELLVIQRAKEIHTKFGSAYLADCDHKGEQKTVLLGGQVLVERMAELLPYLPVIAVICKPARSYQFRDATDEEIAAYTRDYS